MSDRASHPTESRKSGGHTRGPWAWMGGPHGLYLATTHSGRQYVMGFRRMGLQSAQPVFRDGHHMVPASDIVEFEVGDGTARGFAQGKSDNSVYRYDVSGIDSPDARLIAAAPDLLEACKKAAATFRQYERMHADKGSVEGAQKAAANGHMASLMEAAIARAERPEPTPLFTPEGTGDACLYGLCEACGQMFDDENPDGPLGYWADGQHRRCYQNSERDQEVVRGESRIALLNARAEPTS